MAQAGIGAGDPKPVFVSVDPERILDTRSNLGLTGKFTSDSPRDIQVTGNVAVAPSGTKIVVPAGAVAVVANVTVTQADRSGFLSVRPAGATGVPTTSTVNFTKGTTEPNAVLMKLGPGGKLQLYVKMSAGKSAHVLFDIVGYTMDHDHDDRYYTESEVDEAIAARSTQVVSSRDTGLTRSDPECITAPFVPDFAMVAVFSGGLYAEGPGPVDSRVQFSADGSSWSEVTATWSLRQTAASGAYGNAPVVGYKNLEPGVSYRFSIDAANLGSNTGDSGCQLTATIHPRTPTAGARAPSQAAPEEQSFSVD